MPGFSLSLKMRNRIKKEREKEGGRLSCFEKLKRAT